MAKGEKINIVPIIPGTEFVLTFGDIGLTPRRPFFHFLCLSRGFIEPRLKSAFMLPSHVDGGFHAVSKDDELRRSASTMRAKWAASERSPQSTQMSFTSYRHSPASNFYWIFCNALIYDPFGSAQTAPRKRRTRGLFNVLTLKTDKVDALLLQMMQGRNDRAFACETVKKKNFCANMGRICRL
jgi:hypothetical protein